MGRIILVLIILVIVVLAVCYRDRIFKAGLSGEGTLLVTGKSGTLYYVYDEAGIQRLNFTSVGRETELLPGTYQVQVGDRRSEVEIKGGEITEISMDGC
jgi:hypothetical protein